MNESPADDNTDDEKEEMGFYSDGIDPVVRTNPEELFLVIIEAVPDEDSPEATTEGGAFVNCWLNVDTLRDAEREAVSIIEQSGWIPVRFDSFQVVSKATYEGVTPEEGDPDPKEILAAAFEDGAAVVFHTWAIDGEEEDD